MLSQERNSKKNMENTVKQIKTKTIPLANGTKAKEVKNERSDVKIDTLRNIKRREKIFPFECFSNINLKSLSLQIHIEYR